MLLGLRALLNNFGRHAHRARRNLAQTRRKHVRARRRRISKLLLDALVRDEEQRRAGRGAYDRAADAIVDSAEATGRPEAGGGLQAGFERVEREEGGVDCCAC